MIIKECIGYELEKAQSNTPEDFFNRSSVTFVENGEEKTFHVLYVRYFDEQMAEITPFNQQPLFTSGERDVNFTDIVALVCLLNNPKFRNRKRAYINSYQDLVDNFLGFDFNMLPKLFDGLENQKQYTVEESLVANTN